MTLADLVMELRYLAEVLAQFPFGTSPEEVAGYARSLLGRTGLYRIEKSAELVALVNQVDPQSGNAQLQLVRGDEADEAAVQATRRTAQVLGEITRLSLDAKYVVGEDARERICSTLQTCAVAFELGLTQVNVDAAFGASKPTLPDCRPIAATEADILMVLSEKQNAGRFLRVIDIATGAVCDRDTCSKWLKRLAASGFVQSGGSRGGYAIAPAGHVALERWRGRSSIDSH